MEEGLRFRPTEAELLKILRQFVVGQYIGAVVECRDLYGDKEPWEICTGTGTATDDNTWYFFTELKRKNAAGKRFLRSVGNGTWHGTSKVEKIFHDERKQILLGFKRDFTYWGDEERRGEFVMNEFSLPENTVKPYCKDFVICRLKRKKAAPPPPLYGTDGPAAPSNGGINDVTYEELFAGAEVVQQEDWPRQHDNIIAALPLNNNPTRTANWFGYVHPFDFLGESEEPFQLNNNNIAPATPPSIPVTANGIHDNTSSFAASPHPDDDFFRGLEPYEHQSWSSNNVEDYQGHVNYEYYSNETYPCNTNAVAAPPRGVDDGTWTLQMMEDFLLKDDDNDGGEEAAVAIQEDENN